MYVWSINLKRDGSFNEIISILVTLVDIKTNGRVFVPIKRVFHRYCWPFSNIGIVISDIIAVLVFSLINSSYECKELSGLLMARLFPGVGGD